MKKTDLEKKFKYGLQIKLKIQAVQNEIMDNSKVICKLKSKNYQLGQEKSELHKAMLNLFE